MIYALAPDGTTMRMANDAINALVADRALPLALFHDHFLDRPGGTAVFQVRDAAEVDAIDAALARHLGGWQAVAHPLIFAFNAAAFDEQIAYTLREYQGEDWEALRRERRPRYGNPAREAETGIEA
jgi:hypothetical protein